MDELLGMFSPTDDEIENALEDPEIVRLFSSTLYQLRDIGNLPTRPQRSRTIRCEENHQYPARKRSPPALDTSVLKRMR